MRSLSIVIWNIFIVTYIYVETQFPQVDSAAVILIIFIVKLLLQKNEYVAINCI